MALALEIIINNFYISRLIRARIFHVWITSCTSSFAFSRFMVSLITVVNLLTYFLFPYMFLARYLSLIFTNPNTKTYFCVSSLLSFPLGLLHCGWLISLVHTHFIPSLIVSSTGTRMFTEYKLAASRYYIYWLAFNRASPCDTLHAHTETVVWTWLYLRALSSVPR